MPLDQLNEGYEFIILYVMPSGPDFVSLRILRFLKCKITFQNHDFENDSAQSVVLRSLLIQLIMKKQYLGRLKQHFRNG